MQNLVSWVKVSQSHISQLSIFSWHFCKLHCASSLQVVWYWCGRVYALVYFSSTWAWRQSVPCESGWDTRGSDKSSIPVKLGQRVGWISLIHYHFRHYCLKGLRRPLGLERSICLPCMSLRHITYEHTLSSTGRDFLLWVGLCFDLIIHLLHHLILRH